MRTLKEYYDDRVLTSCLPDPIVNKEIQTKGNLCIDKDVVYILTVKAYKANYGDYLHWYIECNIDFDPNSEVTDHPFRKIDRFYYEEWVGGEKRFVNKPINQIGEVVADNEYIRKLLEFLIMLDEELEKHTGIRSAVSYRSSLIEQLSSLCD